MPQHVASGESGSHGHSWGEEGGGLLLFDAVVWTDRPVSGSVGRGRAPLSRG
ncbi:hypothetical protein DVS28_a5047 [Euzebya pacifica]|uniref:Uncharacterized protein n=1 Tax=Euzebya pacifica TaxID=1608957 RepID=A0A346Y5F6_9ACTN|nr:hypothetical protein DVS28_a5047 [Euzebya pacifica]